MKQSQIKQLVQLWKSAPRIQVDETTNVINICDLVKKRFKKDYVIVEILECKDVDNAWLLGLFFEYQNLVPTILTCYKCTSSQVLPTNELSPDIFFKGIPFNYLEMSDHLYINDNDTGERIIIDEYL